jgi:hypothetical protein
MMGDAADLDGKLAGDDEEEQLLFCSSAKLPK